MERSNEEGATLERITIVGSQSFSLPLEIGGFLERWWAALVRMAQKFCSVCLFIWVGHSNDFLPPVNRGML